MQAGIDTHYILSSSHAQEFSVTNLFASMHLYVPDSSLHCAHTHQKKREEKPPDINLTLQIIAPQSVSLVKFGQLKQCERAFHRDK